MRVIIVGSGRVGAGLASRLADEGHEVVILDTSTNSFRRLAPGFSGQALRGDGTDSTVLERAGAREAEWFFALTEGDNRNILAAQLARQTFGIPNVLCKINDPVRSRAYSTLGVDTINRTEMMLDSIGRYMGRPAVPGAADVNVAVVPAAPAPGTPTEAGEAVAEAATAAVTDRARSINPISQEAVDTAAADSSGGH